MHSKHSRKVYVKLQVLQSKHANLWWGVKWKFKVNFTIIGSVWLRVPSKFPKNALHTFRMTSEMNWNPCKLLNNEIFFYKFYALPFSKFQKSIEILLLTLRYILCSCKLFLRLETSCIFLAQNGKAQIYVFPCSKMAPQLSLANFLYMLWFRKPNCDPDEKKKKQILKSTTRLQSKKHNIF